MKTVASLSDLSRLAIERGAVATVGGRVINSSGSQLKTSPKREVEPEQPAPAPQPQFVSIEEVERLLRERDEQWEKRLDTLSTAILMIGQKTDQPPQPAMAWDHVPEYDEKGRFINLRSTRVPAIAK